MKPSFVDACKTPDAAPRESCPNALNTVWRIARRVGVTVAGLAVVLVGMVLIFTPGPAVVVIPAGVGILALEYAWARRWLARLRDGAASTRSWWKQRRGSGGKHG